MNTRERHHEQVIAALIFLSIVGFSIASHLQVIAGRSRRGLATQLKKLGLIVSRNLTPSRTIIGLSKKGADMIGAKQIDIYKISASRVEHALIGQFETLASLEKFGIEKYYFEPQDYEQDTRPDVVWICKDGKYFLEVELSAKSIGDGDMDKFFLKLIRRRTIVIFRDQVLLDRYVQHARRYYFAGIPQWELLEGDWIKFDDQVPVSVAALERIYFKLYKDPQMKSLRELLEIGYVDI